MKLKEISGVNIEMQIVSVTGNSIWMTSYQVKAEKNKKINRW